MTQIVHQIDEGGFTLQTVENDPAQPIDHVALGLSRVAKQFQNSPKFLAYLTALLEMNQSIEDLLQSMYELPDIDVMSGVNLDVIGRIVGISRVIPNAIELVYFGFNGFADQTVFGELGQDGIGSRFYNLGDPTAESTSLGDVEYRILLKAKIKKNVSHATGEDIENVLSFIFGAPIVNVDDFGGMNIGIAIGRQLTQLEQAILTQIDLLPRPACVTIVSVTSYDPADYFGFSELSGAVYQPGALGFGELGIDGMGGIFADMFVPMAPAGVSQEFVLSRHSGNQISETRGI